MGDGLVCENFLVSQTSPFVQLELRNTFGKNILTGMTVDITGEGDDEGLWGCTPAAYNQLFENGEIALIPFTTCNIQVSPGKKINGKITVTFTPVGSSIQRTITGTIRATVS
jgi:hypothetical protein